jgi:hypothetical protein
MVEEQEAGPKYCILQAANHNRHRVLIEELDCQQKERLLYFW